MINKIKERAFPFLIALSALSVSASAAFYSISGLSKLFAGAAFAVIVMAASLEVAKLVIASLLYQYRKTLPLFLKGYLSLACVVLILITSMGIYGFLSSAYQETANKEGNSEARIVLIETKRDNVREQLEVYTEEKTSINEAVSELRKGLSNNKIQWRDKETGQIITSTSSRTRKALEKQLDQAIIRQTEINSKVDVLNERIFEYETEIVETRIGDGSTSELGPLKYLSGLTGLPMDKIINYLLLTIIFVFDPLAIALVIAANFAFARLNNDKKQNIYGEIVKIRQKPTDTKSGLQFKDAIASPISDTEDFLEEEVEEKQEERKAERVKAPTPPSSTESSINQKLKELKQRLSNTPKTKRVGPNSIKSLKSQIESLKKDNDKDDDLTILY